MFITASPLACAHLLHALRPSLILPFHSATQRYDRSEGLDPSLVDHSTATDEAQREVCSPAAVVVGKRERGGEGRGTGKGRGDEVLVLKLQAGKKAFVSGTSVRLCEH